MKILRAAAPAALALLLVAGCAQQPAWQNPTYPPRAVAVATPFAGDATGVCAKPKAGAPEAWLAVVCPVVDRLVKAQTGLRTLERLADDHRAEETVARAAASSQELAGIETALNRVPSWAGGTGTVGDLRGALSNYTNAIEYFRYSFLPGRAADGEDARRYLASGDATIKRVMTWLGSLEVSNPSLDKYAAFMDHAQLAIKQAYAQFDKLRVAHNIVNSRASLPIAKALAAWSQSERDWLIAHPTDACYRDLKDDYLRLVITPAGLVGRNYARWASLWPKDDDKLWNQLDAAVESFGSGYGRFNEQLESPDQTCATT